jgi:hypothetical protein
MSFMPGTAQAPIVEVLEEGLVGRQGPDSESGADDLVFVGEWRAAERGREARFAFDLDDQHAGSGSGGGGGQRSRHGRLPDPALAGHDDDAGGGAELLHVHGRLPRTDPRVRSACYERAHVFLVP